MASSVVCTCYPTLPLHKNILANSTENRMHVFCSPTLLFLPPFLPPVSRASFPTLPWLELYTCIKIKSRCLLFVISCRFLFYMSTANFFMYIFILLYINCTIYIHIHIFGRGARPFLASVQRRFLLLLVSFCLLFCCWFTLFLFTELLY